MSSPIGRNAYFLGGYVRHAQSPNSIHSVRCLLELLFLKHGYSYLSLFSRDELACVISYLSAGYFCIVFMYLVYDFNNK